jgi:hypothetical protein
LPKILEKRLKICVFSIAGIVSNVVSIISTFIAIKNANLEEKIEND